MRKYVEILVNAKHDRTVGNHGVHLFKEARGRVFTYHGTGICLVWDDTKECQLTHKGWFTTSTTQALRQYEAYFKALGYECKYRD